MRLSGASARKMSTVQGAIRMDRDSDMNAGGSFAWKSLPY